MHVTIVDRPGSLSSAAGFHASVSRGHQLPRRPAEPGGRPVGGVPGPPCQPGPGALEGLLRPGDGGRRLDGEQSVSVQWGWREVGLDLLGERRVVGPLRGAIR